MKYLGFIIAILFLVQASVAAQCDVNYKEALDTYCSGIYLIHQELSHPDAAEAIVILHGGNSYNIYLLNPIQDFSGFLFLCDGTDISGELDIIEDRKAAGYQISIQNTREYKFSFLPQTDNEACVLLAIYLHNDPEKPVPEGIYKNFAELKYRSPSFPFTCSFTKKKTGTLFTRIYHYKLDIGSNERRRIGEAFAFADGDDLYINIDPRSTRLGSSTRFVKAEDLKMFYYFEYYESTYVPNQFGGIYADGWQRKLIDKLTGEVIKLNRSQLQQLIKDDPELLEEFRQESSKSTQLKEYLIRYVERNH